MTQIVITGASGLLGGAVLRELGGEGWSHTVAALPDGTPLRRVELCDGGAEEALREARPDLVVHCAALTDVDACEDDPETARALNTDAPGRLAATAAALGAGFVQISTDAVYDGDRDGRHAEDEPPRPLNAYARTKLDGERAVLEAHPRALVVRTTMHGWSGPGRASFSEAILGALREGRRLTLFRDVVFSPLNVADLAALIGRLAERGASGVLNVGASDAVTKEAFGRLVARTFELPEDSIEPIDVAGLGLRAPRPRNQALAVERLTQLLGAPPPSVADGVRRMREEEPT